VGVKIEECVAESILNIALRVPADALGDDARVPALDSAMADASAPREGVAYGVTLGSTFAGDARPGEAYAAFKYDWRAPAIDPAKPAVVRREGGDGDAGAVTVEFQNVVEGERPINYRGTYVGAKRDVPSSSARDVGVECALVFDAATGAFTVEKIGGAVKSLRVSRDARGDDEGVGVGVNEDTITEKAKKKPRKQDPKEAAAMEQAAAAVAKATEARSAFSARATETAVGPFARFVSDSEGSDLESEKACS
jgi:hypothetical protein